MTDELKKQPETNENETPQDAAPVVDQVDNPEPVAETGPAAQAEPPKPDAPAAPAPSSASPRLDKFKDYLRKGLILLAVVVFFFVMGFALDHFLLYRPAQASLSAEVATLSEQLDDATDEVTTLETSLSAANQRIESLEGQNADLQQSQEMDGMQILLLQTLADLNAAQVALLNDDVSGAKVALLETEARIETLIPLIETVDATLAENLPTRFELVRSSLDTDAKSAGADLALLAQNLLNIEKLLFTP